MSSTHTCADLSPICLRARLLFSKGLTEDALALYGDVLQIDPANAMAYADRGTAYAMLQRYDLALPDLRHALDLGYADAATYCTVARICFALNQAGKALDYYTRALQIDASYALAWFNRSSVLQAMGDSAAAQADLQHCLTLDINETLRAQVEDRLRFLSGSTTVRAHN